MISSTRRVIEAVSACFGVTVEDVLSRSKLKCHTQARQTCLYVLREFSVPQMSYPEIAREFPGHDGKPAMDHTTVMHAFARTTLRLGSDAFIRDTVEIGRRALDAARADQRHLALLAKCSQRAELERRLAALNAELEAEGIPAVAGAAE